MLSVKCVPLVFPCVPPPPPINYARGASVARLMISTDSFLFRTVTRMIYRRANRGTVQRVCIYIYKIKKG